MAQTREKIIQIISRTMNPDGETAIYGLGEAGNLFIWNDKTREWERI